MIKLKCLNYTQLLFESQRFQSTNNPNKFLISLVPIASRYYHNCARELYTRANIEILHLLEPKELKYTVNDLFKLEHRLNLILDENKQIFHDIIEFVKAIPARMMDNQIEIPEYSDGHRELTEFNEKKKVLEDKLKRTAGSVEIKIPVVQNYVNIGLFQSASLATSDESSIHELYKINFIENHASNQWRRKVINTYLTNFSKFIIGPGDIYARTTENDSLVGMHGFISEKRGARNATDGHLTVLIALANYIENPNDENAYKNIKKFIDNVISRLVAYYTNGGTQVTPPIQLNLPNNHHLAIITTLMQYGPLMRYLFRE